MIYSDMINAIMYNNKKSKLPHWKDKYLYIERNWVTEQNKEHIPFLAIVDGNKVGPAILHNCDMFKDNWIVF